VDAWPPQASYPCGNFSVTSAHTSCREGSLGPAFAPAAPRRRQAVVCPCARNVVSPHAETTLGRLRYPFAAVPPQPNCPHRPVPPVSRRPRAVQVFHRRIAPCSLVLPRPAARDTAVKLNRVFFPRWPRQARSLGCGFAALCIGTVGISLIHSCTSLIR